MELSGCMGIWIKANQQDSEKAKAFVKSLYQQVEVLDSGARGATNTLLSVVLVMC